MRFVKRQPIIRVGIMDRKAEIVGRLNGNFYGDRFGSVSGQFSAKVIWGMVTLFDDALREICGFSPIRLTAQKDSTFTLFNVTIGNHFHWERKEDQTFQGDLMLATRED